MTEKKVVISKPKKEVAKKEDTPKKELTLQEQIAEAKKKAPKKEKKVQREEVVIKPEQPTRQIDENELIPCRSMTKGILYYKSKRTGTIYEWADYGDVTYIEFKELQNMLGSDGKAFVHQLLFVIEDEDVVKALRLQKFYENYQEIDNLSDLFYLDNDILVDVLKNLPHGLKESAKAVAVQEVRNGNQDSASKIRTMEEGLGVELKLFLED